MLLVQFMRILKPEPGVRGAIKVIIFAVLSVIIICLLIILLRQPSHDRDWREEIAVMPEITGQGPAYTIDRVRDWTYTTDNITQTTYHEGQYNIDDLVGTWLMVEPFGGSDAIAHTLILFEFQDESLLAITIEARKEKGEIYSALRGAFNTYELVYLWAEARDVLTRRARYLDHEIYVYPISLSDAQRRTFFQALVEETNQLAKTPRFYNTLFSNCTNELAKTAGLKWNSAFITTGYAPQHLFKVGMIAGKADGHSFAATKNAAHVTDIITRINDADTILFDRAFLRAIKARFGALQNGASR